MRNNILTITLLLFYLNIFSQNNEISFGRYSFMESKGYKIKIKENQANIIIELKLADSISSNLYKDKKYRKLKRKFNRIGSKNEQIDIEVVKLMALDFEKMYEKYTFYKTNILIIAKAIFSDYSNEFTKIINYQISTLENNNNSRILLDGYFVTFIKKTKNQEIFLNLNTPNEESHPILIKFLKETFKVFRSEYKSKFVDKEYTFGL